MKMKMKIKKKQKKAVIDFETRNKKKKTAALKGFLSRYLKTQRVERGRSNFRP